MLVSRQVLLDQALKKSTFLEVLPNASRELIDSKEVKRVATMQCIRNHVRNVHQARVLLRLFCAEFHLVKRCLKQRGIYAVLFYVFESFEKYVFNLLEVFD